jgi:hypothetical protein
LRKAKEFVRRLGVRVRGDGHNELSIAFPNGSRIVGLPENETTIRGFSDVSLLLIDEASRVPDEVYRAMRPTLVVHDGDSACRPPIAGGFQSARWRRRRLALGTNGIGRNICVEIKTNIFAPTCGICFSLFAQGFPSGRAPSARHSDKVYLISDAPEPVRSF